jgi:phage terminase Nu1 subunit (DNA packaging protein)
VSAALLDAPATLFADRRADGPAGGGRTTLAELLDETWRAARATADADCPMCHERMQLEADRARCSGCGTTLA